MDIRPFSPEYLDDAARLFIANFRQLRSIVPVLPPSMEDHEHVMRSIAFLMEQRPGLAAFNQGQLAGYLGWFQAEDFRGSGRTGAYVPEWGHACVEVGKQAIYQALYREAGILWTQAGCLVHALTYLAHDQEAEKAWYWNGFGLTVVDAVRPVQPLGLDAPLDLTLRKATLEDVEAITTIDREHWAHYNRSPVFMPFSTGRNEQANTEFLSKPKNRVWLAEAGNQVAGFMRFEGYDFDGVAVVESDATVAITGAYVKPECRGRRAAVYMLESALREYQELGLSCCALNFESFNPEAATFWMRYFEPVCYSAVRTPEAIPVR